MPVWKFSIYSVISAILPPAIILLLADDWQWPEGWIFGVWFDVMVLSNLVYLYVNNPELLADRTSLPGSENQKQWDKYLMIVIFLLAATWFIVMPLDARRFGWTSRPGLWLVLFVFVAVLFGAIRRYQFREAYCSNCRRGWAMQPTGAREWVRSPYPLRVELECEHCGHCEWRKIAGGSAPG